MIKENFFRWFESREKSQFIGEDVKKELFLHMAKSVLDRSINSYDNFFRFISSVTVVSIPAYILVLGDFKALYFPIIGIQFIPILLWIFSLYLFIFLLYPRITEIDYSNLIGIIDTQEKTLLKKRFILSLSLVIWLLGMIIALIVLILVNMYDLKQIYSNEIGKTIMH